MALIEVRLSIRVLIVREPRRAKCAVCELRRTLYRVRAGRDDDECSDARCAECWGMK